MLLTNAKIATMSGNEPYGFIEAGALSISGEKIAWVGNQKQIPDDFSNEEQVDLNGCLVTPGLIDCHTHVIHGGNRAEEFEMRLKGHSYEEISRAGGGINSTVCATRQASLEDLVAAALPRVDHLISEGVTTIEVKSGYGLDLDTELRMLRAARQLESHRNVRVKTSFLCAHAVPQEFTANPDDYIRDVCIPGLEAAAAEGLVDAVDGFCEGIAFNVAQIETVFLKAVELGLPIKLHAEQLSHSGGCQLASRFNAMSVDHVEYATEDDAIALASSDTVAVLLPGAFYTLRETQRPPVSHLRKHSVPLALATDCNPGSSPMSSLLLAMNMGCTLFKMTPEEALLGVTKHAAKALGLHDCGSIEIGKQADLCIWNVEHPAELSYRIGYNPIVRRVLGGEF